MPRELYQRQVLFPAGAPPGIYADMNLPERIIRRIDVRIPPGPSGNVGFAIYCSLEQVIPYAQGEYIIADDEYLVWELDDYITTGSWQVGGYNIGYYDHTIYLRFHCDPVQVPTSPSTTPIPAELLSTM